MVVGFFFSRVAAPSLTVFFVGGFRQPRIREARFAWFANLALADFEGSAFVKLL